MKSTTVVLCAVFLTLASPHLQAQTAPITAPAPNMTAQARQILEGYGLQPRLTAEALIASPAVPDTDKDTLRAMLKTLNEGIQQASNSIPDPPTPESMQAAAAKA